MTVNLVANPGNKFFCRVCNKAPLCIKEGLCYFNNNYFKEVAGKSAEFPERSYNVSTTEVIRPFDPWKSKQCTCPPKFSLNPYTGCSYGCLYCYITSFIPSAFNLREKKDLIKRVLKDLNSIPEGALIAMSNSSDPYPEIEKEKCLTREILKILKERGFRVIITTKGNIVIRDIDILREMKGAIAITITTFDDDISDKLEPFAPKPFKRLEVLKEARKAKIPASLRLDPLIPGITDSKENIRDVIGRCANYIDQVITSTFKPRPDSLKRVIKAFPESGEKLSSLLSSKIGNSYYLSKELRLNLIELVRKEAIRYNLAFSSCREDFSYLNTAICDGSAKL